MEPGDLESRVTALEGEVHDLTQRVRGSEQDAAAARVLAGAADRDVSEIRGELRDFRQATTSSFNALRQDFVGLRRHVDAGFARVDEEFARVHEEFAHVDEGFVAIRGKLDGAAAGQQQIIALLHTIIADEGRAGTQS